MTFTGWDVESCWLKRKLWHKYTNGNLLLVWSIDMTYLPASINVLQKGHSCLSSCFVLVYMFVQLKLPIKCECLFWKKYSILEFWSVYFPIQNKQVSGNFVISTYTINPLKPSISTQSLSDFLQFCWQLLFYFENLLSLSCMIYQLYSWISLLYGVKCYSMWDTIFSRVSLKTNSLQRLGSRISPPILLKAQTINY